MVERIEFFAYAAVGTVAPDDLAKLRWLDYEGEADVPGAEAAAFLRLEKDLEIDGETVEVEQLQVMLDMPGGQASVVRFIAEAGKWEEQMEAAYDSLVVAEETGS